MRPLISSLQEKYPELTLESLEVYNNATNQQRFVDTIRQYNISTAGVPIIIIGDVALVGETSIRNSLEERILTERARAASCNTSVPSPGAPQKGGCPSPAALSPQAIILPALADSLNPCALSVLIFLLISIAAAGNRRRILLAGSVYVAAVFLFHLLLGIGIFSMISFSGYAKTFSLTGAAVAIILGIITLADLVRGRETFTLSVPESGKGILSHYLQMASLPAAFVLGILAGILGFSCTGGIYISILAMMGTSMTVAAGMPYLLLYNIVFVLPLVIVTFLVAYGIPPEKADTWRARNKRVLRLVIGFVLIALGLLVFTGWFG